MKSKITIQMEAHPLREIRALATEECTSVSAFIAAHFEQLVRERKRSIVRESTPVARLRRGFDLRWTTPASRDELRER